MINKKIVISRIAMGIMIALSLIATVIKIWTGFDIDEAYALALPYRGLQGDRLFAEMWEVHQTSYFIPFLFMKLYSVMVPSLDYLVLFMRSVAAFLHIGMSVLVFFFCRKTEILKRDTWRNGVAFIAALVYCNFLPKWMMDLDFSMLQLWFFTLFLIFFIAGEKCDGRKSVISFLFAGLALAVDVLAYPGMVLLYPAAVVMMVIKAYSDKKKRQVSLKHMWYQIGSFTLGCLLAAVVFFICIFRYMSLTELLETVPKVFMDGAHQYDFVTKISLYASQWMEVFRQTVILLVPALAFTVVFCFLYRKFHFAKRYGETDFFILLCLFFELEVSALITFAGLMITWGPFRLQVRYIIQFVMAFFFIRRLKKMQNGNKRNLTDENEKTDACVVTDTMQKGLKNSITGTGETSELRELQWIWWLSLIAYIGILVASNVGPTSSASYLVIGNILFVVMTLLIGKEQGKLSEMLSVVGAVFFVISLILCKGFYMRNTEYVPGDITDGLVKMQEGPLAGIYVAGEDQVRFTSDYHTIKDKTNASDKVLFMGTESLCNLYANGTVVSPTTISTPAFNEQWVEYFDMHPDKMPTIIFLAKNTVDNREKFFAKNPFGIWIAENYDVECMEETDSLCVIREKK